MRNMSKSEESNHQIQSPELAHHVGYAEYPHMEMAATALRVGMKEDYKKHVAEAESAGAEAGRVYLDGVTKDLASYALVSETLSEVDEILIPETFREKNEAYPGIHITKDEMIKYAEDFNVAGSSGEQNSRGHTINRNANKASTLWASFSSLKGDLSRKQYPDADWYHRTAPLIELEMDIETQEGASRPDSLLSISMDTLVNLLDEFDKTKALYPSKSTGQILGTGFGDSKLAFLREFVEYKKAQLAKE